MSYTYEVKKLNIVGNFSKFRNLNTLLNKKTTTTSKQIRVVMMLNFRCQSFDRKKFTHDIIIYYTFIIIQSVGISDVGTRIIY